MLTRLFIDDLRDPPNENKDGFIVVRNYSEAIHWMRKNGCPDYISFDHDLGFTRLLRDKDPSELNGYDIAKWMVEQDINAKGNWFAEKFSYVVHSANPIGAANIIGLLDCYLRERE